MICKMYMYVLKQSKSRHIIIVHDVYAVTFNKRKKGRLAESWNIILNGTSTCVCMTEEVNDM